MSLLKVTPCLVTTNMSRSEHLPTLVGTQSAQYAMGVDVVLNFLKYVDLHDVCPEYADDVKSAQSICLRALEEVPATTKLLQLLPGHFNAALSMLHVKQEDGSSSDIDNYFGKALPDVKQAKASHAATLSILMGAHRFPADGEWFITETVEFTFEVLAIDLPSDITRAKYKAINQHLTNYVNIQPCGTITARPVIVRDGWDNSMTATIPPEADKESQFVLEEDILHLIVVGMKLTMRICTLNVGLKFIKSVTQVRPSFYVFLPQELMFNYKEPLPTDRPAKSVHDFDDENDVRKGGPVVEADD